MMLDLVAQYLSTLKSLAEKPDEEGAAMFDRSGCAACHVPALKANDGSLVPAYTDLLLHKMGPELDDHVGEPGVSSDEWRTPPLKRSSPNTSTPSPA